MTTNDNKNLNFSENQTGMLDNANKVENVENIKNTSKADNQIKKAIDNKSFFAKFKETYSVNKVKPRFLHGLLIGFTLSYYLYSYQVIAFLNKNETLFNDEIDQLKLQIKDLKNINKKNNS